MPRFERQVFICVNERPAGHPKGCCSARGGREVRERFAEELFRRDLRGRFRATVCGCLDLCERGVALVVYPEQVWYGGVRPDDVPEIVEQHLLGGQPVERLRIDDREFQPPTPPADAFRMAPPGGGR
ncbi:MAG: (2Fe-2S) ferredoxin domain-containing protein [Candidatus Eiseniibacteriota bacterium]|jgi:(2Fe-2S) ferredoxin